MWPAIVVLVALLCRFFYEAGRRHEHDHAAWRRGDLVSPIDARRRQRQRFEGTMRRRLQ